VTDRNERQTGQEAASAAGKVLNDPDAPEEDKTAAASALSQTPPSSEDEQK
jgi:hypothetical protein